MLLSVSALWVCAADAPKVTVGSAYAEPGSSVTVSITVTGFSGVGAADLTVYYDPQILSVTKTSNGSMVNGSTNLLSANTATAGQVRITASAVSGFSASGTLLKITFKAAADAPAGEYPLPVTVGDAYGVDLTPMALDKVAGSITVRNVSTTVPTFTLSSSRSVSTAMQGDTVTLKLSNSGRRSFAAAEFVVTYDDTLLAVTSAELDDALLTATAQHSINTATPGTVRITYASAVAVSADNLLYVHFTVIGDTAGKTTLDYAAVNIYDGDQQAYTPYSGSSTLTLQKLPQVADHPDLWLDTEPMVADQSSKATVLLEKGAAVAAGVFVITYDPQVLRCVSVTPAPALTDIGGVVLVDDDFTDGSIEFPYVNSQGYSDTDIPLVDILWEPLETSAADTTITPSASMVYDASYHKLTLEAVAATCRIGYRVEFRNADESVLECAVYYRGEPVNIPNAPTPPAGTDPAWVFSGWDKAVSSTCQGSAVYTAVFAAPYLRGDMNRDDLVTDADAIYLLRFTLFPGSYPIFQDGDLNGDGIVTDADAIYLLRHTLFPDSYPI